MEQKNQVEKEHKFLIERVKNLGFDPRHYFVASDAAAQLHGVQQKKVPDMIHLIASPDLFKQLVEKHGLAPARYNVPPKVVVEPGVEVSTRFWKSYRGAVQQIDSVPVLRLGKLYNYMSTNEGSVNVTDSEAVKAKVASVLKDCKDKGKSNRQIGDHLGLSEQSVPVVASRLLKLKRSDWHDIGRPEPKAIVARLEETRYNWTVVEKEFFPEKSKAKAALMKILNGTPEWEAAKRKGQ